MFPTCTVQSITASVAKQFAKKKHTKSNIVGVCCARAMEDTIKSEPTYKSKISFSVESLLSSKDDKAEEEHQRLDEDEEDITVDEDTDEDLEGRESASPGGAHTVLVPQPLHPSVPRLLAGNPHHPQWPFSWMGHPAAMVRAGSPQSKFLIVKRKTRTCKQI